MKRPSPPLILASASPRRAEILRSLGWTFQVVPPGIDETRRAGEPVLAYVRRMARRKAETVGRRYPRAVVLAADTVVYRGGRIYGKPSTRAEAKRMLAALRGRRHRVSTALCLRRENTGFRRQALETTLLRFRNYSEADMRRYIRSEEPFDKAGGYGIQGLGGMLLVESLDGSYSNVVGLPAAKAQHLLEAAFSTRRRR